MACSVALHAAVLFLATRVAVRTHQDTPLIRLSLVTRGGGNGANAPASLISTAPAEIHAAKPIAAPVRQRSRPHRRGVLVESHKQAQIASLPSTTALVAPAPESVPADKGILTDGAGAGSVATEGSAGGGGSGAGVGSGGGSGDGDGNGAGPDQRAACVYCPQPVYPLVARARGWQGTAEVALSVLADGSVEMATLWRSSGYSALDQAALAAARRSRFSPPRARAPLRGRIEYRFELMRSTWRGTQE